MSRKKKDTRRWESSRTADIPSNVREQVRCAVRRLKHLQPALVCGHKIVPVKMVPTEMAEGSCWLALGSLSGNSGYPQTEWGYAYARVKMGLHTLFRRYAHSRFGPMEGTSNTLHRCAIRTCVNPAHTYTGTCSDNQYDRYRHEAAQERYRLSMGLEEARIQYTLRELLGLNHQQHVLDVLKICGERVPENLFGRAKMLHGMTQL